MAFAFVAMGGWTLYANHAHGLGAAWLPALVQGAISGIITLVLKRALEGLAGRFGGPSGYLVPPLITATAILALLLGVHRLIGTPEVWRTIAVPWSVSTVYAFVYSAALARGSARRASS